jgi:hypothetical protein
VSGAAGPGVRQGGPELEPDSVLAPVRPRAPGWKGLVGFALGVLLLAIVGWTIFRDRAALDSAWAAVRTRPAWAVVAALALPLCNWLLVSLSFWVMMRRYGPIAPGEMTALIGGAWLLNYLPLRAGMVGRVAYHRAVNRIAVRDSLRVMIYGMALGAAAVATMVGIVAAVRQGPAAAWGAALGAPLVVAAGASPLLARAGRGWVAAVYTLRYLDMLAWVARYALVFWLIGRPLGIGGAIAVAAACQVALVLPLIGNGLGLRELAVGLMASTLPPALGASTSLSAGSLADLVNRLSEIAVAVPVGLCCLAWLAPRAGAVRRAAPTPDGQG